MKKKITKIMDKFLEIIIIAMTFYCPTIYYLRIGMRYTELNYGQGLWIILPILLIIYIYNCITKKIKIGKIDIIIYILSIFGIISTIFAVDKNLAIFGTVGRNEGLLTVLCYYFIILNMRVLSKKSIKLFLHFFMILGLIECIYGFIQIATPSKYMPRYVEFMSSALLGNPNFYGSYLVIMLGLSIGYYIFNEKYKIIYYLLSIIFYAGLISSQSTTPFIGVCSIIGFLFLYGIATKRKKTIILLLVLVVSFIIMFFSTNYILEKIYKKNNYAVNPTNTIKGDFITAYNLILKKEEDSDIQQSSEKDVKEISTIIKNEKYERKEATSSNDQNSFGSGRFYVWKTSIPLVKRYLWIGCGLDNFKLVYPQRLDMQYYDKAHNIYLQILITNGVFALIGYLYLMYYVLIRALKSKDILINVMMCSIIGYLVQGFSNISVIQVCIYLYTILGFMIGIMERDE